MRETRTLRLTWRGLETEVVVRNEAPVWTRLPTGKRRLPAPGPPRQSPTLPPRILSELLLLDHVVAESTVAKYMIHKPKPPSQNWRTFLKNHVGQIAAADFFTVPTVTFRVLYVFLVLRHDRRLVVHFNVTRNPTARWTAQQIIEAFPYDEATRFLLRDRDSIYGEYFRDRVEHMGIEEVLIAPRAPWQNPYVERVIGSIRRECLDHMIVLGEDHLRRILTEYLEYYNWSSYYLIKSCA